MMLKDDGDALTLVKLYDLFCDFFSMITQVLASKIVLTTLYLVERQIPALVWRDYFFEAFYCHTL